MITKETIQCFHKLLWKKSLLYEIVPWTLFPRICTEFGRKGSLAAMPLPPGVYAKKVLTSTWDKYILMLSTKMHLFWVCRRNHHPTTRREDNVFRSRPPIGASPNNITWSSLFLLKLTYLITPSTSIFLPRSGGVWAPTNNKEEPCALPKKASTLGVVSILTGREGEQNLQKTTSERPRGTIAGIT